MSKICDACETVAHCSKHGCIPMVTPYVSQAQIDRAFPAPVQPANDIEAAVQRIMIQASVVASAWSLVGSMFDFGQAEKDHTIQKDILEKLLYAELSRKGD